MTSRNQNASINSRYELYFILWQNICAEKTPFRLLWISLWIFHYFYIFLKLTQHLSKLHARVRAKVYGLKYYISRLKTCVIRKKKKKKLSKTNFISIVCSIRFTVYKIQTKSLSAGSISFFFFFAFVIFIL